MVDSVGAHHTSLLISSAHRPISNRDYLSPSTHYTYQTSQVSFPTLQSYPLPIHQPSPRRGLPNSSQQPHLPTPINADSAPHPPIPNNTPVKHVQGSVYSDQSTDSQSTSPLMGSYSHEAVHCNRELPSLLT